MTGAWLLPVLAAVLGFALARANSCTVAATARLVEERKADWIAGLAVAGATAGGVLALLNAWGGSSYRLPLYIDAGWSPIVGGAVMGAGALMNKGCMLGSISALGRGNLNYLFTLVGLAMALLTTREVYALPMVGDGTGMAGYGELASAPIFFASFALLIAYGLWQLLRRKGGAIGYLMLAGAAGALLFASNPYWSYVAAIDRGMRGEMLGMMAQSDVAAIILFLGATFSAWLNDRLNVVGIDLKQGAACLIGGCAMGFGAQIIPGGNDTLLLWTIPGLATYGALAYFTMIAVIAFGLIVISAIQRNSTTATD